MRTDMEEATLDQRFEVGPHSELSVSNVSGHVTVNAGERSEIIVHSSKRGSHRARENTQVDIRKEGNKVSVQTRSATAGLINFGRASAVDYNIEVPRDCEVRVHGVSSDVAVRGCRADVGVQTVSGDIQIRDAAGDITMTTVSGDIHAVEVAGTLVARTTSGDGQLLKSRLRRFSVNTVSGDFTIESPLVPDEHCVAKTVSGDLELLVPENTGATIQLKSVSGSVACELPAEIIKSGRRHWQGRINGGGGHVEMNSVSGDLRIRRAAGDGQTDEAFAGSQGAHGHGGGSTDWSPIRPVPPSPPRTPMAPRPPAPRQSAETGPGDVGGASGPQQSSPPDATAEILRALERGELSVDEAMSRLEQSPGA